MPAASLAREATVAGSETSCPEWFDAELLGRELHRVSFPVERGKIAEFARATGERNPIFFDEQAARAAGFSAIPTPVTFTQTVNHYLPDGPVFPPGFDIRRIVHGASEYEIRRLPLAGETLTASFRFVKVFEKTNKQGGTMHFAVRECALIDEQGEEILFRRDTLIETPAR